MVSDIHQMDTILQHASLLYQKEEYKEALCMYIQIQDLVMARHNQQAPCRMFRDKAYLRVFKAVLYSSMGACLVSMHRNPEAYELLECSLKMCPTPLASQRLILLLIHMNRLPDIQEILNTLLKPAIIRQDIPRGKSGDITTIITSDALLLQSVLLCYSGSIIECLNTLSLSIILLLRKFSKVMQSAANKELFNLPAPEILQDLDKLRCRLTFLALCNIMQTFSHRGVILPYRCDYNIEELIMRLCNSKVKGLCLNTIFDPSFVSHEAHNAFTKYGGTGHLPGSGFQSLDSLYSFFQAFFPSIYNSDYLPIRLSPFFDDKIFSSEAWSAAASRNVVYSRLKGQATLIQQGQLLEVMDDADLALLILKQYSIKPLSYLFTLPDHLLSLITGVSLNSKRIVSQSSNSIDTVVFTHKDSTTIAKIMRAKENQTIRAFRLAEDCIEESSIHPTSSRDPPKPPKESADPLRESLRFKVMSYLQLPSSSNKHSSEVDSFSYSHSIGSDGDIASTLVLRNLRVSRTPLKSNNSALNLSNGEDAEQGHIVTAVWPTASQSKSPESLRNKHTSFTSGRVFSNKVQSRVSKLSHLESARNAVSLPSYSLLHRSEMDVPNVCLSTLKQLLLKKKKRIDHTRISEDGQTLVCTNLPIVQKIESVRPLAVKASTQSTPSTTLSSNPYFPEAQLLPNINEYGKSLSLHDHTSIFRKAPVLQHPMRNCISCPVVWTRDRSRHLGPKAREQFRRLHNAALSVDATDSLSFKVPYYTELVRAINFGDREEILLNYSMGHKDTELSDFDFIDKEQLNSYKKESRSQSLEQNTSPKTRLLQDARTVFNSYRYVQTNISKTRDSLNRLALAMRTNDNKIQSLIEQSRTQIKMTANHVVPKEPYYNNTDYNTATSPDANNSDHMHWSDTTDTLLALKPIFLPDLKTIVSKKPVHFMDYFLNHLDLELVHGDPHERRTLLLKYKEDTQRFANSEVLHFKAAARKRANILSTPDFDGNHLRYRMNATYVPDYQELDQSNSAESTNSTLLSNYYPSKAIPDILRGVGLELINTKGVDSSSSDISTSLLSVSTASLASLDPFKMSSNQSPDVQLQARISHNNSLCRDGISRLVTGSKLYKKNTYRYNAFADILFNSTIAPHATCKGKKVPVIHINTDTSQQHNAQIKLSLLPKKPRRPKRLTISDVIRRNTPITMAVKVLRLRTASFLFKIPL
ncbi:Hypothetical protein GLP15_1237 [Giardia lamblia P15]|uniref:Uncharacterized protein n=1 Tax=Giardia intestinalis (strain P15) TaxID=658858 RepID=E1EZS4_GIAIA|nr:Hypothetical protein GLP15_1237 [Giardia lamblia P15]